MCLIWPIVTLYQNRYSSVLYASKIYMALVRLKTGNLTLVFACN